MVDDISTDIPAEVSKIRDGIPATDLIKSLLKFIAIDAAKYQRDVNLAHQVFYRSRVAYEAISTLATAVEQAAVPDWDSFGKYTGAIPPLERLLLQFYAKNLDNTEARRHLPPQSSSPLDALTFISGWTEDRKMLTDVLDGLANDDITNISEDVGMVISASRQEARTSDDKATIAALHQFLKTSTVDDKSIGQPTSIVKKIKVLAPTTDEEWRERLKDGEIWTSTLSLVATLLARLESTPPNSVALAEVEEEWNKLKELLVLLKGPVHDIETLPEMLELIKLAAKIRRPFHGRTVELIRMLHRLDTYSSDGANSVGMHRKALKDLMHDAIKAVEETSKEVTDVKAITTTSSEYQKHDLALHKILEGVQEAFKAVELEGEWNARDQNYKAAVKVDESHLNGMRRRLGLEL
ncbi:hypothetical protein NLJ89_g3676 [Agrocybe chaxingu]|uniref:Uncharacterized protein n=1 Tax=Agrocybe chaxingu TaxID=84603 RepID=A0A9W8MX62_9AGAR|nr:hypothetical protein NLJ89_g3676 [Agrocybe chaxingu]